jgi:hypothetical protein
MVISSQRLGSGWCRLRLAASVLRMRVSMLGVGELMRRRRSDVDTLQMTVDGNVLELDVDRRLRGVDTMCRVNVMPPRIAPSPFALVNYIFHSRNRAISERVRLVGTQLDGGKRRVVGQAQVLQRYPADRAA